MSENHKSRIWVGIMAAILVYLTFPGTSKAQQKPDTSKSSVIRSTKPTQRPVVEKAASATKTPKPLNDIKANRSNCRKVKRVTRKFAEVKIAVSEQFSIEYISTLPRAPASDLELLDNPERIKVQLPVSEVKALISKGADVVVLRNFVLIEGFAGPASSEDTPVTLQSCSGTYGFGENDDDVDIPDYDGWVYSEIFVSEAPALAIVSCIDVHYEIVHDWVGDLDVDLTDENLSYEYDLWENEGGGAQNINETETGITMFNGEWVNQVWLLWAMDVDYLFSGYIDYWWIKVYYEQESYYDYIQADSYFENTVGVLFIFSGNPGTVCFSISPECGSLEPNCTDAEYDSGYWWVSTQYRPCEDECSSVTITAEPSTSSQQTETVHVDDRFHTGCGQQYEVGVATYDMETGEPTQTEATVSVIPTEAGTAEPDSGLSQWDPNSGQYIFWTTYTADCNYVGRARVRFYTAGSTIIYSFDQHENLSPSANWQTVSDSFCVEGWHYNYYQIYRMYLCSNASYDFSVCDIDGIGGWCDGDGDFEMLDSAGTSLWYIDGASDCDYDASTLSTEYEGWSPDSDGYYYLKVSEYYGHPMSYNLAYRGGIAGDFAPDCSVNLYDYAVLAWAWLSEPNDDNWNAACDISEPNDNIINEFDLAEFTEHWLE